MKKDAIIYHLGKKRKTLCGRLSDNIISSDNTIEQIKAIVEEASGFLKVCKICKQKKSKK